MSILRTILYTLRLIKKPLRAKTIGGIMIDCHPGEPFDNPAYEGE